MGELTNRYIQKGVMQKIALLGIPDEQLAGYLTAAGIGGAAGVGLGVFGDRKVRRLKESLQDQLDSGLDYLANRYGFQRINKKDREIRRLKDLVYDTSSQNSSFSKEINNMREHIKKVMGQNNDLSKELGDARVQLESMKGVFGKNKELSETLNTMEDKLKTLQMDNANKSGVGGALKNLGSELWEAARRNPGTTAGIGLGAVGLASLPFLIGNKSEKQGSLKLTGSYKQDIPNLMNIKLAMMSEGDLRNLYMQLEAKYLKDAIDNGLSPEAAVSKAKNTALREFVISAREEGISYPEAMANAKRISRLSGIGDIGAQNPYNQTYYNNLDYRFNVDPRDAKAINDRFKTIQTNELKADLQDHMDLWSQNPANSGYSNTSDQWKAEADAFRKQQVGRYRQRALEETRGINLGSYMGIKQNELMKQLRLGQITEDQFNMAISNMRNDIIENAASRGYDFDTMQKTIRSFDANMKHLYDEGLIFNNEGLTFDRGGRRLGANTASVYTPQGDISYKDYMNREYTAPATGNAPGAKYTLQQLSDADMSNYSNVRQGLNSAGLSNELLDKYSPVAGNGNGRYWIGNKQSAQDYMNKNFTNLQSEWDKTFNETVQPTTPGGQPTRKWDTMSYDEQMAAKDNFLKNFKKQDAYSKLKVEHQKKIDTAMDKDYFSKLKFKEKPNTNPNPNPTPTPGSKRGPWEQIWHRVKAFNRKVPWAAPAGAAAAGAAGLAGLGALGYGGYHMMKNMFGKDDKPGVRLSFG